MSDAALQLGTRFATADTATGAVPGWLADLWSKITGGFTRTEGLEAQPWVLLALVAGAAALSVPRATWRWFGMYVTFVHELGHAFAALTAGRRISGIELR